MGTCKWGGNHVYGFSMLRLRLLYLISIYVSICNMKICILYNWEIWNNKWHIEINFITRETMFNSPYVITTIHVMSSLGNDKDGMFIIPPWGMTIIDLNHMSCSPRCPSKLSRWGVPKYVFPGRAYNHCQGNPNTC